MAKIPTVKHFLSPSLPEPVQREIYEVIIFLEQGRLKRGMSAVLCDLRVRADILIARMESERLKGTLDLRRDLWAKYFTMSLVFSDLNAASGEFFHSRNFHPGEFSAYQAISFSRQKEKQLLAAGERCGWA